MADIELVIKIPEEIYEASQIISAKHEDVIQIPLEVIANGKPLPKGHGRLIDISEYEKYFNTAVTYDDGNHEHVVYTDMISTIIEASKEHEDGNND